MKGSIRVKRMMLIAALIRRKNRQIRLEKEKNEGYAEINRILTAYLSLLIEKRGSVRVPKAQIKEALGRCSSAVVSSGNDYVITVSRDDVEESDGGGVEI